MAPLQRYRRLPPSLISFYLSIRRAKQFQLIKLLLSNIESRHKMQALNEMISLIGGEKAIQPNLDLPV